MTSGATLYREDTVNAFRSYINSANSRGASVITAYKTNTAGVLTDEVQVNLHNVEFFEISA